MGIVVHKGKCDFPEFLRIPKFLSFYKIDNESY